MFIDAKKIRQMQSKFQKYYEILFNDPKVGVQCQNRNKNKQNTALEVLNI